jgi:hypothetical protein
MYGLWRSGNQPCFCLWRGFLQTTRTTFLRRTILQLSQILFTEARTFMGPGTMILGDYFRAVFGMFSGTMIAGYVRSLEDNSAVTSSPGKKRMKGIRNFPGM